jgi:hypothetical protein
LRQDDNTGIGVNEGDLKKAVLPSVGSDRRLKDNIACSDKLGLEFVVPLINSVKELSNKNQEQQKLIESTNQENQQLNLQLQTLQEKVGQLEAHLVKSGTK